MTAEPLPSRAAVEAAFDALVAGRAGREATASWASTWFGVLEGDPEDMVVWDGLSALAVADAAQAPGSHVYGTADFEVWRREFLDGCAGTDVP